jgi:hypothetical protein
MYRMMAATQATGMSAASQRTTSNPYMPPIHANSRLAMPPVPIANPRISPEARPEFPGWKHAGAAGPGVDRKHVIVQEAVHWNLSALKPRDSETKAAPRGFISYRSSPSRIVISSPPAEPTFRLFPRCSSDKNAAHSLSHAANLATRGRQRAARPKASCIEAPGMSSVLQECDVQ